MKKTIVMTNGESKSMEIEEVLKEYRGIAISTFKMNRPRTDITEDDRQELDIVIFKAFQTYDEEHCFSTHLVWKLRQYFTHTAVNAARQKRNTQGVEFVHLDCKVTNSKRSGAPIEIHEYIADENSSFEDKLMDRALLSYIAANLNEFEMKLLAVNLGTMRSVDLAEQYNTSKQNINGKNKRFKEKLLGLINEYNA